MQQDIFLVCEERIMAIILSNKTCRLIENDDQL
jgi:hypothetical protein